MAALEDVFIAFCSFGSQSTVREMDGKSFTKLCKDAGLIDKKSFSAVEADLCFAKVKAKGQRKIGFAEFRRGLQEISLRKGLSPDHIADLVMAARPKSTGTVADAVKFHDDKTLYTGVHVNGGPSILDRVPDLSAQLDRSDADVRGVKHADKAAAAAAPRKSVGHKDVLPTVPDPPAGKASSASSTPASSRGSSPTRDGTLKDVFRSYCLYGGGRDPTAMEGSMFTKCLKDCGLISRSFTPTSADLLFAKVKAKGEKKITFQEFRHALALLASQAKHEGGAEAVEAAVAGAGGPKSIGATKADAVRFHDDKSLYTGVYAQGGPTNVDRGRDLASIVVKAA